MGLHLGEQGKRIGVGKQVYLLKKLQDPFALVLQGFVIGGLLFWATQGEATPRPAVHAQAIIVPN
jgi:hypothetical protein